MDRPPVAAKECILKVNIHCRECEGKVNRALRNVDGVYSVGVHGDTGRAIVIGNMDPFKLIKALKKKGKHAEILQYKDALPHDRPLPPPRQPAAPPADNQNQPNVRASQQASTEQHHVVAQMAHLQHLPSIDKMKQVELTNSKSLKVTFKDSGKSSSAKSNIVMEDVCGPQAHQNAGLSHGVGASCSVASGSSDQGPSMTCGEGGGPSKEAASKGSCYRCTSPPLCCCCCIHGHHNHHVPKAPTPMAYPYHGVFANEHLDGCTLM